MIIDLEKLKNYIGKSNCIHCDTEEKANELLECLDKLGWRWASGQPLIGHNFYSEYGKETCYHLNIRNTLSYGSVVFYPKGDSKIIEFDDLLKEFTINDLEFGNILELRSGSLCLLHPMESYCEKRIKNYLKNKRKIFVVNLEDSSWEMTITDETKLGRVDTHQDPFDIVKVYKDYTLKEVLWEESKSILDEVEKNYLLSIIKPFKKHVVSIKKTISIRDINKAFIVIEVNNSLNITLPFFDKDIMYNGMELNHKYTLLELGL